MCLKKNKKQGAFLYVHLHFGFPVPTFARPFLYVPSLRLVKKVESGINVNVRVENSPHTSPPTRLSTSIRPGCSTIHVTTCMNGTQGIESTMRFPELPFQASENTVASRSQLIHHSPLTANLSFDGDCGVTYHCATIH